jgi:uncharacterized protein (DUF2225 family)
MAQSDSPFLLFKVECPICKTINEFETIRVGAYAEEGRDTDFCPRNVKWRFPRYQGYNPLVFFTATCGNCYYSREFTPAYKDWKNDVQYKTYRLKNVKVKHLDELAQADSIVKQLGTAIDMNRFPNESAILKLHLAIYDELLADHCSKLDIGRFYLRISWVYRDTSSGENPSVMMLSGLISEVENEHRRTENSLHETLARVTDLTSRVNAHFDSSQLSAEIKSQMLQFKERYNSALKELHGQVRTAQRTAEEFGNLIGEYRQGVLGGGQAGETSFGQYPSFADFLQSLKRTWSGVAVNEREALEKAVYYYKEAFANGRDIAPGNQQIQASYLIAELSRRIGDYDEAKQYFTSTIKSGQEFIYQNRQDSSRIALAKKILELAIEQGRQNLAAARPA